MHWKHETRDKENVENCIQINQCFFLTSVFSEIHVHLYAHFLGDMDRILELAIFWQTNCPSGKMLHSPTCSFNAQPLFCSWSKNLDWLKSAMSCPRNFLIDKIKKTYRMNTHCFMPDGQVRCLQFPERFLVNSFNIFPFLSFLTWSDLAQLTI